MAQYSTIWGTNKAGVYSRLGTSKMLKNFLTQKIGAADLGDVVNLTEAALAGFKVLPGYELETPDNKPVAVVYSTMYLDRKPGMPRDMKGFCAISVSGNESRSDINRETQYSHTIFFSRQEMLKAGAYNYLDHLMGTYQLTSRDITGHRNGSSRINLDQDPNKVVPFMRDHDLGVAMKTIESIYKGQNVILVLEKDVSFNRRAMELLTQIYALMQPVLAMETGFATYQTAERIQELSAETNVKLYVLPAGADLSKIQGGNFVTMKLSATNKILAEQTPLTLALQEWNNLDWQYRQNAMEHLFAKKTEYKNPAEFISLSEAFFAQMKDMNAWMADTSKNGTIDSLAALQAEDRTDTDWNLVPWAKKSFASKVPYLLKKGTSVEALTAMSLTEAYEYDGGNAELKKLSAGKVDSARYQQVAAEYRYGRILAGINEAVLSQKVWEKAFSRISPAYRAEIEARDEKLSAQDAKHQADVASLNKAHEAEVTALNADHLTKTTQMQTAHAEAMKAAEEAKAAAVALEQEKTAAAEQRYNEAEQSHKLQVEQLNADHTAAMNEKDAAHTAKVNQLNTDHAAALTTMETGYTTKINQMTADHTAALTNMETGYTTKINQMTADHTAAMTAKDTAHTEEVNKINSAYKATLAERQTQYTEAINKMTADHTAALEAKDTAHTAKVNQITADYTAALNKKDTDHQNAVDQLNADHASAMDAAKTAAANAIAAEKQKGEMAVAREQAENQRISGQLEQTQSVLAETEKSLQDTFGQLKEASAAAAEYQKTAEKQTAEVHRLEKLLTGRGIDITPPEPTITIMGIKIPVKAMKVIAIFAAAAFLVGAILSGLIVGLVAGGKDEPVETKPSTVAEEERKDPTDAPTTGSTEAPTDAPTEAPTQPEETALNADGSVNWDYVRANVSWIDAVATDSAAMTAMVGEQSLPEGWNPEAIVTPADWVSAEDETVKSAYITVVTTANAAGIAPANLGSEALLAAAAGNRAVIVRSGNAQDDAAVRHDAMNAAVEIAQLIAAEEAQMSLMACALDDGRMVDLTAIADQCDWSTVTKVSFDENDLEALKVQLDSNRTPVSVIQAERTVGIYDYSDNPELAQTLVALLTAKEHAAAVADGFVLVVVNPAA